MPLLDARRAILLLACGLTLASTPAFPELPKDRAQALTALQSPDAARRAEAIVWIANFGEMNDAALLHERLRDESAFVRGFAEQGLWLLWGRSGDRAVDELMAKGSDEMNSGDLTRSIATFSDVIRRRPEFAEGWNRRATAYYLAGEYERSLKDCAEVVRRNPKHFGALSGYGQIYMKLGQYDKALDWFHRALDVNPNMLGVEFNIKETERLLEQKRGSST